MAEHPRESSTEECLKRLGSHSVGRVVFYADGIPQIYPVNFAVDSGSIVFRTTAYGLLATHAHHNEVAYEFDELDEKHHHGWSVIARGQAQTLDAYDTHDLTTLRMLEPWAAGSRTLHIRSHLANSPAVSSVATAEYCGHQDPATTHDPPLTRSLASSRAADRSCGCRCRIGRRIRG